MTTAADRQPPTWDPNAKWVRIVRERPTGMVEFEFAVGEPQLFVEMVMSREALTRLRILSSDIMEVRSW